LGDEVDQAAWWADISMTSMPFWNLTPRTTFGNWVSPFNRRQVFAAAVNRMLRLYALVPVFSANESRLPSRALHDRSRRVNRR
jgi:hypothetical protein